MEYDIKLDTSIVGGMIILENKIIIIGYKPSRIKLYVGHDHIKTITDIETVDKFMYELLFHNHSAHRIPYMGKIRTYDYYDPFILSYDSKTDLYKDKLKYS